MDVATGVFGVVGVAVGGLLTLGAQAITSSGSRKTAISQLEQERWQAWHLTGAVSWSRAAVMAHRIYSAPSDISAISPSTRSELRAEAEAIERDLYQLSATALDRGVSEWAENAAITFGMISDAVGALEQEDGLAEANRLFGEVKASLTTRIEWNDGTYTTTLDRLRDQLRRSAPPLSK